MKEYIKINSRKIIESFNRIITRFLRKDGFEEDIPHIMQSSDQVTITRFLRKDWLKDDNTRVHANAFKPSLNNNVERLELSCFQTQELEIREVFALADDNNIKLNGKPPIGYCSIPNDIISSAKQMKTVILDFDDTPPRHCNFIGWEGCSKDDIMEISMLLAIEASKTIEIRA